jgi:hypothetical protein
VRTRIDETAVIDSAEVFWMEFLRRRREFITLIGGATAAWPLAARAQQPAQIRRVGMLIGYTENDPETQARLTAFRQAFEQLGWKEGRSVRIDYRFAPACCLTVSIQSI